MNVVAKITVGDAPPIELKSSTNEQTKAKVAEYPENVEDGCVDGILQQLENLKESTNTMLTKIINEEPPSAKLGSSDSQQEEEEPLSEEEEAPTERDKKRRKLDEQK